MSNLQINNTKIGPDFPTYIIAEISCNHEGDFNEAVKIIEESAHAGVNAVKIQTYKPDTITRNFENKPKGTIWENSCLHSIYEQAQTPWDWYQKLDKVAKANKLDLFSSPFDETAVDFLEQQDTPVYKVPSFEVVDTKLLEKIAKTKKPVIMSNGMTNFQEINEAVLILKKYGTEQLALLHCNSGYPAAFEEANLNTIPMLQKLFKTTVGLSDHTLFADTVNFKNPLPHVTPLEAVKKGAKVVEVHIMLDREKARKLMEQKKGGYDWAFSREPKETQLMVESIRTYESTKKYEYNSELAKKTAALTHGQISFEPTEKEMASRKLRPSLWCVNNIKRGEPFVFAAENKVQGNFDSIRPSGGLHIRHTEFIAQQIACRDIKAGEMLSWEMLQL